MYTSTDQSKSDDHVSSFHLNKNNLSEANQPSSSNNSNFNDSFFARSAAASFGTLVAVICVTPLEVVKVRQQHSSVVKSCPEHGATLILNNGLFECVVSKSCFHPKSLNITKNLGTFAMLRNIFQNEGFNGIYAGVKPTLIMSIPNTILYFSAYEEISNRLRKKFANNEIWENTAVPLISGSIARIIATTSTAPLELIRTRQAVPSKSKVSYPEGKNSLSLKQEFSILIKNQGISSLFRGLAPTLLRDAPFSALYWLCLEKFRRILYYENGVKKSNISHLNLLFYNFISGAAAGMISATVTTPFDVVKTRQQTSLSVGKGTIWHLKQITETEGISGLMRGNGTRVMKVAPACAIMISCYELGKKVFARY